jgi:nitroimidazol reductase NimA-like FMN-containing flavoprotein (pyridoxamine 5'-phosphate oxidase superfamily)
MPGKKVTALRENPVVCLQADQIAGEYRWQSVLVYGRYEEITEPDERGRCLKLLFARFPHLTPVEALNANERSMDASIVFRIRMDEITGVAEG